MKPDDRPYTPGSYDFRPRPVKKAEKRPNEWITDVAALFRDSIEPIPETQRTSRTIRKLNDRRRAEQGQMP